MISHFLMILGIVLSGYGTVGIILARNDFQRIHFLGIADTLGAGLIVLGALSSWWEAFPRLLFVFLVSLITGSIAAHVLARSILEHTKRC